MIRPMADLPLYLAEMAEMPPPRFYDVRAFLDANDGFRRQILDRLRDAGPLSSREIPDTSESSWQSSGWTHERNVTQMLEARLAGRGGGLGSAGRERLWDLPERVFPAGVTALPSDVARRRRDERWLRALGIAGPEVRGAGRYAVTVEGTKGVWRTDPEATAEGFDGRTALLSPFDPAEPRPGSERWTCSTSSTRSRCTSRRSSGAGATSRCRSSAMRWSARSTRLPTGRPACCASKPSTRTHHSHRRRRPASMAARRARPLAGPRTRRPGVISGLRGQPLKNA